MRKFIDDSLKKKEILKCIINFHLLKGFNWFKIQKIEGETTKWSFFKKGYQCFLLGRYQDISSKDLVDY